MWVLEDDSDTAGCDDGTTDVVAVFILRVAVVCDEGIACSVRVVVLPLNRMSDEGIACSVRVVVLPLNRMSLDRNVYFDCKSKTKKIQIPSLYIYTCAL